MSSKRGSEIAAAKCLVDVRETQSGELRKREKRRKREDLFYAIPIDRFAASSTNNFKREREKNHQSNWKHFSHYFFSSSHDCRRPVLSAAGINDIGASSFGYGDRIVSLRRCNTPHHTCAMRIHKQQTSTQDIARMTFRDRTMPRYEFA